MFVGKNDTVWCSKSYARKTFNELLSIYSFFKGANITLNARSEEDVVPSVLMEYVFKQTSRIIIDKTNEAPAENDRKPIGTNYKRIVPQNEISKKDRENFWQKQKQEEEERLVEQKKLDSQMKLERVAPAKRDDAESVSSKEQTKINSSAQVRKERLEEAKSVSKNSVNSAKAFFEQNSAASQISHKPEKVINIREALTPPTDTSTHSNGQVNGKSNANQNEHQKEEIEIDDVAEKAIEEEEDQEQGQEGSSPDEVIYNAGDEEQYSLQSTNFQPQYNNFFSEPRTLENIEEEQGNF